MKRNVCLKRTFLNKQITDEGVSKKHRSPPAQVVGGAIEVVGGAAMVYVGAKAGNAEVFYGGIGAIGNGAYNIVDGICG